MVVNKADWRTIVKDKMAVQAEESRKKGTATAIKKRLSRVAFSPDAHEFLVRAAKLRGISLSGYIRRATLARVAADLGLVARDLFAIDAGIITKGSRPILDLDGKKWGHWEVDRGGEAD